MEPVQPPAAPFHIYAQQILALAHQLSGLPRGSWSSWLDGMPGFASLPVEDRSAVAAYLESEGFLFDDSGILGPGPESDRRFRGKGFLELLSVFDSPPLIRVLHGRTELGAVDEATLQLDGETETLLLLGGRSWRVVHVDWSKRDAWVEPIQIQGRSLWLGDGRPLSFDLCQAQRRVLLEGGRSDLLTRRGRDQIEKIRGRFPWLTLEGTTLEHSAIGRARWWTFGGLKANAALADHLSQPSPSASPIRTAPFESWHRRSWSPRHTLLPGTPRAAANPPTPVLSADKSLKRKRILNWRTIFSDGWEVFTP